MTGPASRNTNQSNNRWVVTAFGIFLFALFAAGAVVISTFFGGRSSPIQSDVPTFVYFTSTPTVTLATNPNHTSTPTPILVPVTPTPQPTITPLPLNGWTYVNGQWIQFTPTKASASGSQSSQQQPQVIVQAPPAQVYIVQGTNFTATPVNTPQSSNGCNNILFPARPGSQWVYLVTTLSGRGYLNLAVNSVSNSQAIVTTIADNLTRQITVGCDRDIIVSFPLLNTQRLLGDVLGNTTMNVVQTGGVVAPNEAAFVSNNWRLTWSVNYLISGQGELDGPDGKYAVNVSPSPVTMTCQTAGGGGTITVSAGTFNNTLKVACVVSGQSVSATVTKISTGQSKSVTGQVYGSSMQWFVPGTGLIKSQEDSSYILLANLPAIPIPHGIIAGDLELANYFVTP